jgi:acetyl/propionyl-CoA carboxylase alpha subunit
MTDDKPMSTVLIANRGEIAIRIAQAARAIGLRTIAIYSDADADAPHVRAADRAVRVGPEAAAESYLNIAAILDAARETGAEAIHPGYGFLSERAEFARAVAGAGLVFIGPPADVIEQMGRKDAARVVAAAAGVPVLPSYGPGDEPSSFTYPVLVKAAAGGGGKGMRIVESAAALGAAMDAARREARSAFGDDTLLIERYVEYGRHIEVQVLADAHGNVVHLYERDCSAQRRHQKVIEEAPAAGISDVARAALRESAVALARAVRYVNAGTVEYLVVGDEVYFLEMNTRLQVEHPVTEAVTGVDLVALQFHIARGGRLPFRQQDLECRGHAFEARVYAEDAWNGFLPQAGTARVVAWPSRARVDAALESGQAIGTAYDPMLGKVIVHAADRRAALERLVAALDDTAIIGLTTNTGFLRALVNSAVVRENEIDTGWLDRHEVPRPPGDQALRHAAWAVANAAARDHSPFGVADGWRMAGLPPHVEVQLADQSVVASRDPVPGGHATTLVTDEFVDIVFQGEWYRFWRPRPDRGAAAAVTDGAVLAPMPGTLVSVSGVKGQTVVLGEVLGLLEAMKMEVPLKAPRSGLVIQAPTGPGARVDLGDVLFVVQAPG